MSFLTQLTPAAIQQDLTTAYNQSALVPANTGTGSTIGAIFNSQTAITVGLQAQIAYVAGIARLATSTGADIDSFVNPFGIARAAATSAIANVVFSTSSPAGSQLQINVGTYVQTQTGVQFQVIADGTQPGYNPTLNAYIIAVGGTSVNVTVQGVIPGSAGNVQANTINQILSVPGYPAPTGISQVVNPAAATQGADAESDSALIQRFQNTMGSRWATNPAIAAAVASSQTGLTYTIGDQLDQYGNAVPNFFSVIVNALGQSSAPSQSLLNAVTTVVQNNRPIGVPFTVTGPVLVPVNVIATLTLNVGASASAVVQSATTAVQAYLNNIGMSPSGASTLAEYAQVVVILKGVQGVANVTNLTLNGGVSDIPAGFGQEIVSGSTILYTQ